MILFLKNTVNKENRTCTKEHRQENFICIPKKTLIVVASPRSLGELTISPSPNADTNAIRVKSHLLPFGGEEVGGNSQESPGDSCRSIASRRLTPNIAGAAGPRLEKHSWAVLHPWPGGALPDAMPSLFCLLDQHNMLSAFFFPLKAPCGKMKRKLLTPPPSPTSFTQ